MGTIPYNTLRSFLYCAHIATLCEHILDHTIQLYKEDGWCHEFQCVPFTGGDKEVMQGSCANQTATNELCPVLCPSAPRKKPIILPVPVYSPWLQYVVSTVVTLCFNTLGYYGFWSETLETYATISDGPFNDDNSTPGGSGGWKNKSMIYSGVINSYRRRAATALSLLA